MADEVIVQNVAETNDQPFWRALSLSETSAEPESILSSSHSQYDFLETFALCQRLGVNILPMTYQAGLGQLGGGAQADVFQAIINVQTSFAFKLFEKNRGSKTCDFEKLINEIILLTHPSVTDHPFILTLEGFGWEVRSQNEIAPVLIFEKAQMGDLNHFLSSVIWTDISIAERLSICADIGTALRDMHSNGIVHGDLKPGNVLVFDGDDRRFIGKVADFGYSTRFCDVEQMVRMPKSIPWNAPEHSHRPFMLSKAKMMDIYSFGTLCFWLIFERAGLETPNEEGDRDDRRQCVLQALLKVYIQGDNLLDFAISVLAEDRSLSSDLKIRLRKLFNACLCKDPEDRGKDIDGLVLLLDPDRRISYTNPIQLPPSPAFEIFEISSCFYQLYQADFRLRIFVFKRLQSLLSDHVGKQQYISIQTAALQLALCYELGLGTPRDTTLARTYLENYQIPETDFRVHLEMVKEAVTLEYHEGLVKDLYLRGHIFTSSQTDYYRKNNQLDQAIKFSLREIDDLIEALGAAHPLTISTISQLALILKDTNRLEEAEALDRILIDTFGKNSSSDDEAFTLILPSMMNLAAVYQRRGNYKESELQNRKALSWLTQRDNLDQTLILCVSANLAGNYKVQGRFKEAEELEIEILESRKTVFGIYHIDTLTSMSNLANTFWQCGRWREAEELELEVIAAAGKVLGPDHSLITLWMSNLAMTYRDRGRYDDAERLMDRVMLNTQGTFGKDHPYTLTFIAQVAALMRSIGNLDEAQRLLTYVVTTRQRLLNKDHPALLKNMSSLATLYRLKGDFKETERLELLVVQRSIDSLGENHRDTLQSQINLAAAYRGQNRLTEAEEIGRESLDKLQQLFGDRDPDTLHSMSQFGSILYDLKRYDEAEKLYACAAQHHKELLGWEHSTTLLAYSNLAMTYQMQKRLTEATNLDLDVLETQVRIIGANHPDTLNTMNNLATKLRARGCRDQAMDFMTECIRRKEAKLGSDHPSTTRSQDILNLWKQEV